MPDEPARLAKAREDATKDAETAAELHRHEERLRAINHSVEKGYARLELLSEKLELIATMIVGLGHRIDISDNRFKSAQDTMEVTARVLREKTQQDRDNANSSRDPWRFVMLILAGVVGAGGLLYTVFGK